MDAERVSAQLDRILASAAFAGAQRARAFLDFVVERTLAGRAAELKEAVIAVEALGRAPSFDSKADPIVRVEAGRLRDGLRSYYRAEGEADPLLIDLLGARHDDAHPLAEEDARDPYPDVGLDAVERVRLSRR